MTGGTSRLNAVSKATFYVLLILHMNLYLNNQKAPSWAWTNPAVTLFPERLSSCQTRRRPRARRARPLFRCLVRSRWPRGPQGTFLVRMYEWRPSKRFVDATWSFLPSQTQTPHHIQCLTFTLVQQILIGRAILLTLGGKASCIVVTFYTVSQTTPLLQTQQFCSPPHPRR